MARKSHVVVVYRDGAAPSSYGPYFPRHAERVASAVSALLVARGVPGGWAMPVEVLPFPLVDAGDGVQLELPVAV